MAEAPILQVQVCVALPSQVILRKLTLSAGATIRQAIIESKILNDLPELELGTCKVGIYGKLKTLDTALRNQDRVELYRPLLADPKDARRKRVRRSTSNKV